jgi:hypothetical protein
MTGILAGYFKVLWFNRASMNGIPIASAVILSPPPFPFSAFDSVIGMGGWRL